MLLVLPNSWANYQLLLLLPIAGLLGRAFAVAQHRGAVLGTSAVATLMLLFSEDAGYIYGLSSGNTPLYLSVVGARALATALVWAALALLLGFASTRASMSRGLQRERTFST
jgi:hypothetical protein